MCSMGRWSFWSGFNVNRPIFDEDFFHFRSQWPIDFWHLNLKFALLQCESKKSPYGFLKFFPKRLGFIIIFFTHILYEHFYTTVWVKKKSPLRGPDISHFFHKRLRIFNRFFTHLLNVPIYARLQIFIQLSPTLTELCHIKRDYPVHIIC